MWIKKTLEKNNNEQKKNISIAPQKQHLKLFLINSITITIIVIVIVMGIVIIIIFNLKQITQISCWFLDIRFLHNNKYIQFLCSF